MAIHSFLRWATGRFGRGDCRRPPGVVLAIALMTTGVASHSRNRRRRPRPKSRKCPRWPAPTRIASHCRTEPSSASGRAGSDTRRDQPAGRFFPRREAAGLHLRGCVVFEVATGRLLHQLQIPDGYSPKVVRFLADGKRVAVGSLKADGPKLIFFALADGKPTASPDLSKQRATHVIDVSPDGSRVFLLDNLKKAYMWDLEAGRELWSCDHPGGTSIRPLTPDGKWFVLSQYPQVRVARCGHGDGGGQFPGPGATVQGQPAPNQPVSGRSAGRCQFPGRRRGGRPRGPRAGGGPDASRRPPARPVDLLAGLPVPGGAWQYGSQVWDLNAADDKGPVAQLPAAESAGFSPDGKTLALAGEGFVALWSVGDWKALPQSADPPASVHRVRVTDNGRWVLGRTQQGWVKWPAGGGPAARIPDDGIEGIRRWRMGEWSPCRPTGGWPPR